jgi:hypothetical protein
MTRLQLRFPCSAGIRKLNFDTVHIEQDRTAARENQLDRAIRPVAILLEGDGEQRKHVVVGLAIEADGAHRLDLLEDQRGTPAFERVIAGNGVFPDEAIGRHGELLVRRPVLQVAYLEDRVLHVGGDDREVRIVEREKFERHGVHPEMTAPQRGALRLDVQIGRAHAFRNVIR